MVSSTGPSAAFWKDKRVLVTGHTGFKGSWLCLWLASMGARVHGFALDPPTTPSHYTEASVASVLASSTIDDIRHADVLAAAINNSQPELVFHLAAQPLVRYAYRHPVETYHVNVLGVVHLLEAVRRTSGVKSVVNVTTDKCYENRNVPFAYRESDAMGGHDPYSSSKACAEIVTAAYRRSFFADGGTAVATARAGNVIGGGDWAADRLLPDLLRASASGEELRIRFPEAVRPWQHVLEPLSGYLMLAERLYVDGHMFADAWNFGPRDEDARTVRWILDRLLSQGAAITWCHDRGAHPHEAPHLALDSTKARNRLSWQSRWNLATALDKTWEWHRAWKAGHNMRDVSAAHIASYSAS